MIIEINIECETDEQALTHLSVIRKTLKKKLKESSDNVKQLYFEDDNCYGTHNVDVKDM